MKEERKPEYPEKTPGDELLLAAVFLYQVSCGSFQGAEFCIVAGAQVTN